MIAKIIRGQNQIGGNIIEISADNTKILLDIGLELDDERNTTLPQLNGLFNYMGYDGVFISHYHGDHMGLAYDVYKDIPIYMGENSYKIIKASDEYKGKHTVRISGYLKHKETIEFGDFRITPFLCDHSAFDSYMFLVEANNESILYTGDFRSNGRKHFEWLLKEIPKNIDTLICEGTTLSRQSSKTQTEVELEEEAVKLFREHTGPIFVMQSSMNIDRIVTMYRAAKRSGRIFLQDLYMAEITNAIGGSIPNPIEFDDVFTFITRPYDKEHFRYKLFDKYSKSKISKGRISKEKSVMCVRSSMLNYLESLNREMPFKDGLLIYSLWSGYKAQPETKKFLAMCEELGLKVMNLHTSGHADEETIKKFIETVKPKSIMPIHTENATWFENIKY